MELRKRKHPRLNYYDYRLPGYYYVTIHTAPMQPPLSIIKPGPDTIDITLTSLGQIANAQLFQLQDRYPSVRIDKFVIMPTHIHMIVQLLIAGQEDNPPSLSDVICAYKSLTTREINRAFSTPGQKRFQTSFYESVLRNEQAYRECWTYIDNNPQKWVTLPEDL